MKRAIKILAVLLSLSVCGGGAILSIKQTLPNHLPKNNAVPIDNRAKDTRAWIWS